MKPLSTNRVRTFSLSVLFSSIIPFLTAAEWTVLPVATIDGFHIPESVLVDGERNCIYVSNIHAEKEGEGNARFWAEDGTGSISLLHTVKGAIPAPNEMEILPSSKDAPLHSPKGMVLFEDALWIADVSAVVRVDFSRKPAKAERIPVPGADKLNDLTTDGKSLFASDTGLGAIFRREPDGKTWTKLKAPTAVNGITFRGKELWAVSWGTHEIYQCDPAGKKDPDPLGVADHFTNLDTIEALADGGFIVSDFNGHKVSWVSGDGARVETLLRIATPADVGIDRRNMLLYIPSLMQDKVAVVKLVRSE